MGVYWGYKLQKSTSHFAQSVFHFALMQLESLADLKHIPISFFTFKSIDQLPFEASNPIAIVKKGVRCELRRWEIGCGSCTKAGYEPNARPIEEMDQGQRRRKATEKELRQGMEEMQKAKERFEREAEEGQELALEDGKEVGSKEEEKKRLRIEDAPTESLEKVKDTQGKSSPMPKTSPAAITPARPGSAVPESTASRASEVRPRSEPRIEDSEKPAQVDHQRTPPPGSGMGRGAASSQAETPQVPVTPEMQTPLFSEEQLRQMALLHSQAPWLYQERPSRTFFPSIRRPSFLDREEARLDAESNELAVMKSYMKDLIAQNEELTRRLHVVESSLQQGGTDPEVDLSFSTPNGSSREERKEAERPPKEAERPPEADGGPNRGEPFEAEKGASSTPIPPRGATEFAEKSMEFMVLMMENMKELQRKFNEDRDETGAVRGIEVVRAGPHDLPALPVWSSTQAPLQLTDWLLLIEPVVSDLSATAETWWKLEAGSQRG